MKLFSALLLLIFLNGCNQAVPTENTALENLLGVSLNDEKKELIITVVSKGCTVKGDFELKMQNNVFLLIRKKKDECKAMPEALQLIYTFNEAGISPNTPFTIKNVFIANPLTANISFNEK